MNIPFYKMTGSGNDFIFINNMDNSFPKKNIKNFIQKVCARGVSIGADGFVLIEKSDKADFKWDFYNSDGSIAEMCGNASRCAARFAMLNNIVDSNKMSFETLAGIINAEVFEDESVKVELTKPYDMQHNYNLNIDGKNYKISSVNTGVPHAVMLVDDVDSFDIKSFGQKVRYHDFFQPAGTNVNVYSVYGNKLKQRTYERGVEDETMACGTAAVAVSIFAIKDAIMKSPINIITKSGIELKVYIENDKYFLQGEARLVYTGTILKDAYEY
jgi:diaminopimelate epimerase